MMQPPVYLFKSLIFMPPIFFFFKIQFKNQNFISQKCSILHKTKKMALSFEKCSPFFRKMLFNGTAHLKKCKLLFEYQHLLLLRAICGLYHKHNMIVNDDASVIRMLLQIEASLMIVTDNTS
jgi:hypothetical protein